MALTVTVQGPLPIAEFTGAKATVRAIVQFDSMYLTGGELVTAAMFGLTTLEALIITPRTPNTATTCWLAGWDATAGTIMLFEQSDADNAVPFVEVATTVDVDGGTFQAIAYGKV